MTRPPTLAAWIVGLILVLSLVSACIPLAYAGDRCAVVCRPVPVPGPEAAARPALDTEAAAGPGPAVLLH